MTAARFQKPLASKHLVPVLAREMERPLEDFDTDVDMSAVRDVLSSVNDDLRKTDLDRALVEPLYECLGNLTPRDAADMRFWHYLTTVEFPHLVWQRWNDGHVPQGIDEITQTVTPAMAGRFLGGSTLNGVSRNTLARLWWVAHAMRDGSDYDHARDAVANQDKFQSIFERFFGIDNDAARACVKGFVNLTGSGARIPSKWLQQCLSTTLVEALSEDEVASILGEAFPRR